MNVENGIANLQRCLSELENHSSRIHRKKKRVNYIKRAQEDQIWRRNVRARSKHGERGILRREEEAEIKGKEEGEIYGGLGASGTLDACGASTGAPTASSVRI